MKEQNNEYLDLIPEQDINENLLTDFEEAQDLNIGFEFGDASSSLEGIPTMDLEIGLTDF